MTIRFETISLQHIDIILGWFAEPFIHEFWDNKQGHKDDILNFVNGRKEPSNYCNGKYFYWIASCDDYPFAMLMTIQKTTEDHRDDIKLNSLSKTGHTYGIDYMIGNKNYFGKGYGAKTLSEFLDFFRNEFDVSADTFIIDPASDNHRAKNVYMKAGFEHVADFVMFGDASGAGKPHHLLIKLFEPITPDLARKLIAEQFPEYAHLPITSVEEQGHDNRTYRLGKDLLIRMPTA
ncbi:MAG: GNAT family N-acetyltransferase [Legionella sp.]